MGSSSRGEHPEGDLKCLVNSTLGGGEDLGPAHDWELDVRFPGAGSFCLSENTPRVAAMCTGA